MSNIYNRRLFKPRPARAKLNQMGGIMASSVPLMQSVQKFANGQTVRIPGQQLRDVTGRGFRMTGPIFSGEPIANTRVPSSRALVPSGPVTTGGLPSVVQRGTGFTTGNISPRGPASRARPAPLLIGQDYSSKRLTDAPVFGGISTLLKRIPVASGLYGIGRGIADPLEAETVPSYEAVPKQSIVGKDLLTGGINPEEVFVEDFDELPKEEQDKLVDSFNLTQRGKQEFSRAGEALGQFVDPTLTTISDVLGLGLEERFLEKKANIAEGQFPELSKEEYRRALKSKDPEKFEESEQKRAGLSPTMRGPTAADIKKAQQEITENQSKPEPDPKPDPDSSTKAQQDADKKASDAASAVTNPNIEAEKRGAILAQTVADTASNQDLSASQINEKIRELLGRKDETRANTKKQILEENEKLYKEIFNEDPKDIKTENGFNLAFLGFAIAAGDSPNTLKNIAQGAMKGVEKFSQSAKERKARQERYKQYKLDTTLKIDEEFRKNDQRMAELKFGADVDIIREKFRTDADLAKFAARITLEESRFTQELNAAERRFEESEKTKRDIANIQNKRMEFNAKIGALGKAGVEYMTLNPDVDINNLTDEQTVDFSKFMRTRAEEDAELYRQSRTTSDTLTLSDVLKDDNLRTYYNDLAVKQGLIGDDDIATPAQIQQLLKTITLEE